MERRTEARLRSKIHHLLKINADNLFLDSCSSDGLKRPTGQVETLGSCMVWEQQLLGRAGDVPSQGLDAVSDRSWFPK